MSRWSSAVTFLACLPLTSGQEKPRARLTLAQQEEFLQTAKVLESRHIGEGRDEFPGHSRKGRRSAQRPLPDH